MRTPGTQSGNGGSYADTYARRLPGSRAPPQRWGGLGFRAALVIVAWAVSGPFLGFSAWQLVINTGDDRDHDGEPIQNTQNRTRGRSREAR
jgi:hypothetical protein